MIVSRALRHLAPWVALVPFGFALALPRVPVPAENPITEPKRVLGKIMFWDEQLSSDNTVACGTCHRPASGGADPRFGRHPGTDAGTIDDVFGSPGIVSMDSDGMPVDHEIFGRGHQITGRLSPSIYGALWAEQLFWDGRAGPEFHDPLTGDVVIDRHGALEAQTLVALSNDAEMMKPGRTWPELTDKLYDAAPLALATEWPKDVRDAIAAESDYPALFEAAFGDPEITPVRIALSIAAYQRTLVPDQTPWDRYQAGDDDAMSQNEIYGWRAFQSLRCMNCHEPPLFTNNDFFNIGLRRSQYDPGRQAVTQDPADAGDMKVPSLRNAGLRPRFMHTGEFTHLGTAIGFYVTGTALEERDDIPNAGTYTFNTSSVQERDLLAFIGNALTDPRVRDETFPFDRPRLRTERAQEDVEPPTAPGRLEAEVSHGAVRLSWEAPQDDTGVVDYVLQRNRRVLAVLTATEYVDSEPADGPVTYRVYARDAATNASDAAELTVEPAS
jgi:cytochrome c peroxidase